jgi:hypothetical protein
VDGYAAPGNVCNDGGVKAPAQQPVRAIEAVQRGAEAFDSPAEVQRVEGQAAAAIAVCP